MSTVFISSVVNGFEEYRQAAREAVELMDHRAVMSESFGARPYSPEVACINEAEQSDVYLLILGPNYGFETDEGISVTHAEFRAARAANRPILAFVQQCDMEPRQETFRREVEAYQGGVFRASFSTSGELKDQVIRALRQLETTNQAISEGEFTGRIDTAIAELSDSWNNGPELVLGFLPQPEQMVDIVGLENELDGLFRSLCDSGITQLRDGYEAHTEANWTGLVSGRHRIAWFPDGLIAFLTNPTVESDSLFSGSFAPPDDIERIAKGFRAIINANAGYVHIALLHMENTYVAPVPSGTSLSMRMGGSDRAGFSRLFVPLTVGAYDDWIEHCINRFSRQFQYRTT